MNATTGDDLARHRVALETSLLDADVRKTARVVELLADDFLEFGSSGATCTRDERVALLSAEAPSTQRASDFRLTRLRPDAALLAYRIRRGGDPPVHTLRSSAWRREKSGWRMVFHPGTRTGERPAPRATHRPFRRRTPATRHPPPIAPRPAPA